MRTVILAVACLARVSLGRRGQATIDQAQSKQSEAFTSLLLASTPAAAWQSNVGNAFHTRSRTVSSGTLLQPLKQQARRGSQASMFFGEKKERVLVVGATGGVGQIAVAALRDKGYEVRALVRDEEKGRSVLGEDVDIVAADLRDPQALAASGATRDINRVICCTGTTAFPSKRWAGNNNPENADFVTVRNLIEDIKVNSPRLDRFVLVSSVGVTRTDKMPFLVLNAFGVLKWKEKGERAVKNSGFPWTILRPGRLTDGPYTSYDLNTLLKATRGTKRNVQVSVGDTITPEATSRIVTAEAAVQALKLSCTNGQAFELGSTEGEGPGENGEAWEKLFVDALVGFYGQFEVSVARSWSSDRD